MQRAAHLRQAIVRKAAMGAVPRHARFGATYVMRGPAGVPGPRVDPSAGRTAPPLAAPGAKQRPQVRRGGCCLCRIALPLVGLFRRPIVGSPSF
jgi:hypothetical protein